MSENEKKYRKLTPEEEDVIVHKGTERPFSGIARALSLWEENKILVIVEVKKDWNLILYNSPDAVQQAYNKQTVNATPAHVITLELKEFPLSLPSGLF